MAPNGWNSRWCGRRGSGSARACGRYCRWGGSGVVDFAVEQTNHSGHALGGHEQAGGGDGKSNEARGIECIHDRALGRERAVAIAGLKRQLPASPCAAAAALTCWSICSDGGLHIGRACGVEHGAFQGLLGSRGAQATLGVHAEVHAMSAAKRASLRWR